MLYNKVEIIHIEEVTDMTRYTVTKPRNENDGYGILATKRKYFYDISPDYKSVQKLADACNDSGVDLDFFGDILESFLSDCETI